MPRRRAAACARSRRIQENSDWTIVVSIGAADLAEAARQRRADEPGSARRSPARCERAVRDGHGQSPQALDRLEPPVEVVPAESLVAAVAGKSDRDVPPHCLGHRVDGEDGAVGERLTRVTEKGRDVLPAASLPGHAQRLVLRADVVGDRQRGRRLVVVGVRENRR